MDEHKGFGGYLKILQKKARMTQLELAKARGAKLKQSSVGSMENVSFHWI